MGLLDRLFGFGIRRVELSTQATPPPLPRFSTDRPPGNAHRLLLGEFVDCGDFCNQFDAFWSEALGERPHDAIRSFCSLGWLVPTSPARRMELVWDEGTVWRMARERYLPAHGSKETLIARLIDADPDGSSRHLGFLSWFTCSAEGAKWALEPLIRTGTRYYKSGCLVLPTPTPAGNHSASRRIRIEKETRANRLQATEIQHHAL